MKISAVDIVTGRITATGSSKEKSSFKELGMSKTDENESLE